MSLYTKNGRPLQVSGDTIYGRSRNGHRPNKRRESLRHRWPVCRDHHWRPARVSINRQRQHCWLLQILRGLPLRRGKRRLIVLSLPFHLISMPLRNDFHLRFPVLCPV